MGIVCGLIFFFAVASPAPYLLASTIVSGLVFDLILMIGLSYETAVRSRTRIIIAAAISGLAESIVALAILTMFAPQYLGKTTLAISYAWSLDVVLNIILSSIGAIIAFRFLSRRVSNILPSGPPPDGMSSKNL
jgi:hypothetical protein